MKFFRILLVLAPTFALTTAAPVVVADNPTSPFYITEPTEESAFLKGEVASGASVYSFPATAFFEENKKYCFQLVFQGEDKIYQSFSARFKVSDTLGPVSTTTAVKRDSAKIGPPYLY